MRAVSSHSTSRDLRTSSEGARRTGQAYTSFFEACPVLRAPSEDLRRSRLVLCELTARTLTTGLGLLGIDVVDQM
ncbi:MAG: hypothetical protein NVSMB4_20920 [Acidimicrobiales bacterium]